MLKSKKIILAMATFLVTAAVLGGCAKKDDISGMKDKL